MRLRISAAAIVLVLFADAGAAAAQAGIGRDGGQPAPMAVRIRESPPTPPTTHPAQSPHPPSDARPTARLKFVPRGLDADHIPFQLRVGFGWGSFGYVPLWWWNVGMPPQAYAVPAVPVPLPEGAPIGGVQLDIEPRRAQVYVDGAYVGVVSDFSGYFQHLDLVAGPHLITIVAPDYEPLIIEVTVSPGRTITHRGTLTRAYGR